MQDEAWLKFSEQVSCEEYCHVACQALAQPLLPVQLQDMAERNNNTLAAIAALEERSAVGDDDNPLLQEILRLDAKLNALIDIVNHVLVPSATLPPRQLLRFNGVGAVLPAALVTTGDSVRLQVHFDICRGLPLDLAARVERHLDGAQVFAAFVAQGDAVCDAIGRLVFRHHRRKVAEARQLAG